MSVEPAERTRMGLEEHFARLTRELIERGDLGDLARVLDELLHGGSGRVAELLGEARPAPPSGVPDVVSSRGGRARKLSVSMPEDLAAAVQRRVGRGGFSHYVTAAVTRQLELDLLAELSALLDAEHGPVPEELLAEAEAAWPDAR